MNIRETINVFAGGPGSGPNAPCPQCGPQSHKMEEGDIVRIKTPVVLWNKKTGDNDKVSGAKGVVVNVLPKVGVQDQLVKVQITPPTKHHEEGYMEYVKMKNLEIHQAQGIGKLPMYTKPWFKPSPESSKDWKKLDIQPVRKGEVIAKFKTKDGATVTWVRPKEESEKSPKSIKQIAEEDHRLKGQFALVNSLKGVQDRPGYNRVTKMYDTSGMPAPYQKGAGASVWVDTYMRKGAIKNIVIAEQNYTTYGVKTRGILTFSYKNAAQAVGILKTRYGIKTTLKRIGRSSGPWT